MRIARRARAAIATLGVVATIVADHLRVPTDDGSRFDHRSLAVTRVTAGDTFQLADGTPVQLLGVADPVPDATLWLSDTIAQQPVTLMLPSVGTRDAAGRLLAYAYLPDGSCLNVAVVREGLAYADRRGNDLLAGLIDVAETEARRKRRGLWDGLRFEQMPPWRQAWLRSLSTSRPATPQPTRSSARVEPRRSE